MAPILEEIKQTVKQFGHDGHKRKMMNIYYCLRGLGGQGKIAEEEGGSNTSVREEKKFFFFPFSFLKDCTNFVLN